MASDAALEKQKHQGKSPEISDTEKIFLSLGGTITAISVSTLPKNQKNSDQKYGGIDPLCDFLTVGILAAAELETQKNQSYFPLVDIKK